MPVIPIPKYNISPRDEVIAELQLLIDHAITSAEPVSVWDLASEVLETVEAKLIAIAPNGNIIYEC